MFQKERERLQCKFGSTLTVKNLDNSTENSCLILCHNISNIKNEIQRPKIKDILEPQM